MPVSVKIDPFSKQPIVRSDQSLRTPQARVLAVLMPSDATDSVSEWSTVNRAQLSARAGYTAVSGTVTRVINGIRAGSSSGDPHPGLVARGMVEVVTLDVEGVPEANYRATAAGVEAYLQHMSARGGKLPELRDIVSCMNHRYKKGD